MNDIIKGLLMAANLLEPSLRFDHTVRERHVYIYGHRGHVRKEFMAEIGKRGKIKPIKSYSSKDEWLNII